MYDDVESNFWKEHFTHLQHKNMVRTNAERLDFEGFLQAAQQFTNQHQEYGPSYDNNGSYITWEADVTDSIKVRLFFQYQIKGSLMQKQGKDFLKIADAKFPYNPFPEILEFLKNKSKYEKELQSEKKSNLQNNMKTKIAGEFIKAYLEKHFSNQKEVFWNLNPVENGFSLTVNKKGCEKEYSLSYDDFVSQIDKLN